jgi:small subunit ribosomal protein S2
MSQQPSLDELLKAGVHFGHQTIELAQKLAREVVMRGENILFVCTKRQLAQIVSSEAERAGAMYVTERWLGGLLTNFATVKRQIKKLKELEAGSEAGGSFENYTKKEQLMMTRQRDKLLKNLSGIKAMGRLPGLLFVVDAKKERIAVDEANKLGIPIVAICDTNSDPDLITVPIAGNDDAIRSVELITAAVASAIAEARREAPVRPDVEETGEATTWSSERGTEKESDEDRRRKRRPRRRRAKPEAIAARLKGGAEAGDAAEPEAEESAE